MRAAAWCFGSVTVVSAVMPEAALQWVFPDSVMMVAIVAAPVLFIGSAIGAYYLSGKRKITLLLWVLAPLSFFRLFEFLYAGLLWTLRGGMA
jgi:hypothetical protein